MSKSLEIIDYKNLEIYHKTTLNHFHHKISNLYLAYDLKHTSKIKRCLNMKTLKLDEVSEEHTKNDVMIQNHAWIYPM